MQSIHNNQKYLEEYKEQFRNMTDEQIEQHIGLEKVRNVIDGLDKNHGIDEIRKIVKEINQEKEKADEVEKKQCSKCKVFRLSNDFKEGRTQCNKCLAIKQKYRENHREKLKEKAKEYYENNKDKKAEYNKKYREENKEKINEKIECPLCKCFINKTHIDRHFNTIKHQMRLNKSLP